MNEHPQIRPVTMTQVAGILTSTLALFFIVAFATKAIDAYRLRNWRDQLQAELTQVERERDSLQQEILRRQSPAWIEEVLRAAGQVPEGMERVLVVVAHAPRPTSLATAEAEPKPAPAEIPSERPFVNSTWKAWQQLIWGFD